MKLLFGVDPEEETSSGSDKKPLIEHVENHIYFYADVSRETALLLLQEMRTVDNDLSTMRAKYGFSSRKPPMYLHVHSDGGDIYSGFSIADAIPLSRSSVYSIVEGCVSSAATLITIACEKRFIQPNALMLIHQLRSEYWGWYDDIKDNVKMLDVLMEKIASYYTVHSKMSIDEVRNMMTGETWLDAEAALKAGFVDDYYYGTGE